MVLSYPWVGRRHYGTNSSSWQRQETGAVRRAIQNSQESLRALSKRYGINQKTVAKWKKRSSVSDLPTDPTDAKGLGVVGRGRGHHRCLSPANAPAAGRLPACADDPAPNALLAASLPAAPWHFETAGSRRRQTGQEEVQGLSDRLISTSALPKVSV
jgi:hypothetical protein